MSFEDVGCGQRVSVLIPDEFFEVFFRRHVSRRGFDGRFDSFLFLR